MFIWIHLEYRSSIRYNLNTTHCFLSRSEAVSDRSLFMDRICVGDGAGPYDFDGYYDGISCCYLDW